MRARNQRSWALPGGTRHEVNHQGQCAQREANGKRRRGRAWAGGKRMEAAREPPTLTIFLYVSSCLGASNGGVPTCGEKNHACLTREAIRA
eukprot:4571879-Pleurochrysis_carterae.AAC.1